MRRVFSRKPSERQVVNELLTVAERVEPGLLKGYTIGFYEGPDGAAHHKNKALQFPSPDFYESYSGPTAEWEKYWSTIYHELAHVIDAHWFNDGPGGDHSWTFYSICIALSMHVDLPFWSYEHYEINYHPVRWRQGKSLSADLILDRLRAASYGEYTCNGRTIYSTTYCRRIFGKCLTHEIREPLAQLRQRLTIRLLQSPHIVSLLQWAHTR